MTNAIKSLLAGLVLVTGIATAESAFAYDRSVVIVNEGRGDIYSVRISPSDEEDFGSDLLGADIVEAGDSYYLEPRGYRGQCVFDIEITYANGREVTLWEENLCQIGGIVVNGRRAETF